MVGGLFWIQGEHWWQAGARGPAPLKGLAPDEHSSASCLSLQNIDRIGNHCRLY